MEAVSSSGISGYFTLYQTTLHWILEDSCLTVLMVKNPPATYKGRTKSHEQPFFACKPGTADEGEYGGRWNQLLCYP